MKEKELFMTNQKIKSTNIKNKIIVMSGKGGVGKSTVAANLASSLALKGYKTGILDIDLHGPSIPTIFGLDNARLEVFENMILPFKLKDNFKILSIAFFVEEKDTAIIWRGPAKSEAIKQFINDSEWGELDYLIIDCPPGTGDELLSVVQLLDNITGAIIVTTPQKLATTDVKRSINFCKNVNLPIIGLIENMSGFICPTCNNITEIFKSGGGEKIAQETQVPFLGKVPIDPNIVNACDLGKIFLLDYKETAINLALNKIIDLIIHPKTH